MKRKLFTLLTLLLTVCSGAWAAIGDTFKLTCNGSFSQTPSGFFTITGNSFNSKFTGASYDGVTYTKGFKMESSSAIAWTAEAEATVTILQSNWENKGVMHTIKLDGTPIELSSATSGTGYYLYTITNVAAGNHTISRGSGESGLFMVKVEYTSESVDIVANPVITWNSSTKKASITCATDGVTIYYTIDGTEPTASSDVYSSEISISNSSTVCAFAKKGETVSDYVKKDCEIDNSASAMAILKRGDDADAPTWNDGLFTMTSSDESNISYYTIFNGKDGFKLNAGTTYTINIPDGVKVASLKMVGKSRGDAVNATTVSFTGFTPASATFEKGGFVKTVEYTPSTALDYGDDIEFVVGGNQFGAYIELYGDIKTYTVTYAAGANGTGTVAAGEKKYGLDFTLSSNTFTRDGFIQTGWATSDGGPQVYALGGSYTANADITLYPVWAVLVAKEVGSWDFTNWSDATKTGVAADTEVWSPNEKSEGAGALGDFAKGASNIGTLSNTIKYGSTTISETNGLTFTSGAYGIGLIFNLPSTDLGTYHGSQYIWLYSNTSVITIPNVPANATIEIGVESHNAEDARGVTLKNGSTTLTQTQGEAKSKTYQVCKWTNTSTAGDVTITPTKGLHIYYITISEEIEAVPVSTLSGRNYATCVTTKKLDFAAADGITAYIATGFNGAKNAIVLQSVDVVDAATPIIVKTATQGATVNVPVTTADASSTKDNALVAGDGTTAWDGTDGYTYYYIASDQFHKATKGTLQSGKAYLKVANGDVPSEARAFGFVFEDEGEVTGIHSVSNSVLTTDQVFDLQGRRVAQPTKGLYIMNGRKVIFK